MIAIASCWPPSVAAGSGTTVSQDRLLDALQRAGVAVELLHTSRFATNETELAERLRANSELKLDEYEAVLGIDGEGWLWAPKRQQPYIAMCEAVLVEVLPFEDAAAAEMLRMQAEWEGAAARIADAVVARSAYAAECVSQQYGVPESRINVVPIPFDVDAWRASLPNAAKRPLVLAVGHLYPRKNYETLLQAWRSVSAQRPKARLRLIGTGPQSLSLQAAAEGMSSVELGGHISFQKLRKLYSEATVFCHPSLQENFGIAPVEALASGLNVVVNQHPALLESTANLPGTWAVDARRPELLARALIEALDAPPADAGPRLERLRAKLDPLAIGRRLGQLLAELRVG